MSTADYDPDSNCNEGIKYTNHVVALVGIKEVEGTLSWVIQNSWGTDWGDNGFGYIAIEEERFALINKYITVLNSVEDNHSKSI